jgi:hypothetical protein
MASSTGPVLTAGAVTWANVTFLGRDSAFTLEKTARIGIATALAAGILYGVEKASQPLANALAWATLATVLLVRVDKTTPTPLERAFKLIGG